MSDPDWVKEINLLRVKLDGYLKATDMYVNHNPSVGLQMLYKQISDTAEEIAELYRLNLP